MFDTDTDIDLAESLIEEFRRYSGLDSNYRPERDDFAAYYEGVYGWKCPWFWRDLIIPKITENQYRTFLISLPPGHSKPVSVMARVLMGDGSQKFLGGVEVGDYVIGHSGLPRRVLAVHEQGELQAVEVNTDRGRQVMAALDHPFLTSQGWIQAGDLKTGMELAIVEQPGQSYEFTDRVRYTHPCVTDCRCLTVEEDHTFVAEGMVVSNTSTLSAYMAWRVGRNPNLRILVATHTLDYSSQLIDLAISLLQHPISREVFGPLVPSKDQQRSKDGAGRWTRQQKYINRPDHRLSDPTFMAVAVGSSTVGHRCDLVIADDLVSQANSMTDTMRRHISNWYWSELDKRLDPGGMIVVSGARFYAQDMYSELIERLPEEARVILPSTPEKPLWPERFPAELLAQYEHDNYVAFQAQYRMEPVDLSKSFLNESWLRYYIDRPERLHFYIGVDPKAKSKTGDDMVLLVGGIDDNQNVYIVDWASSRGGLAEQRDLIVRYAERWDPILIGIEANASQQLLVDAVLEKHSLPIVPLVNELPQEVRFANMGSLFKNGKVFLPGTIVPGGAIKVHPACQAFVSQWRNYPYTEHDDWLSAMQHLLDVALRIHVQPAVSNAQPRPQKAKSLRNGRGQFEYAQGMGSDFRPLFH